MADSIKHLCDSVVIATKDTLSVIENVGQSTEPANWQDNILLYVLIGLLVTIVGGVIVAIITNKISIKHRTITISHKSKEYVSKYLNGTVSFDYTNNNGRYIIGKDDYTFTTCWSKASNIRIHAYSDANDIDCIGIVRNVADLSQLKEIETDNSSRSRTANIGDVVIWKNKKGHTAATKVLAIKDDSRKDDVDELTFEYVIFE